MAQQGCRKSFSKLSPPRPSWRAIRHTWPTSSKRPVVSLGTCSGFVPCRTRRWAASWRWKAMTGRLGWGRPGPTSPCRRGHSWTIMIKAGRPWRACNSSSVRRPRKRPPRQQPLACGSAIPRIASISWQALPRAMVSRDGRWPNPTAALAARWTGLPRDGRSRPFSSTLTAIPRHCSPAWSKATCCRRASTWRPPPR